MGYEQQKNNLTMQGQIFAPLFEYIEANLHTKINMPDAARSVALSPVHLTRLFSFAYGITPAEYIRRRKLSESLRLLQESDQTVLDIALQFGFSHEQSFTRAFCAEFGTTPGKYRNEHMELPVLLPIPDFGVPCGGEGGRLFGPETVFLPKIKLLGVWHEIPYQDSAKLAPKAALDFWESSRMDMDGGEGAEVFYGLTRHPGGEAKYSRYLTAVEAVDGIGTRNSSAARGCTLSGAGMPNFPYVGNDGVYGPDGVRAQERSGTGKGGVCTSGGFAMDSFGGCPCIKFHYIGRHHYRELSQKTARQMYAVMRKHIYSDTAIPAVDGSAHLEKIDASEFDGEYCLMEWYAPVCV